MKIKSLLCVVAPPTTQASAQDATSLFKENVLALWFRQFAFPIPIAEINR